MMFPRRCLIFTLDITEILAVSNFTTIAPNYRQTATLQKSASERLHALLQISRTDNVLDLGCGTGHLTQAIRAQTDGTVVGVDPSEGMIAEAMRNHGKEIEFHVGSAEALDMPLQFDAIFCNSAFQWFREPERAIANCHAALRPGGRMVIQAPARKDYCPNFILAVDSLKEDCRTRNEYSRFRSPWLFLETAQDYAGLFARAGFTVQTAEIESVRQRCSPAKVFEMFESGAAAGYLNPDCYDLPLPPGYLADAREVIARNFQSQAGADGQVELLFFRIYLLARKP